MAVIRPWTQALRAVLQDPYVQAVLIVATVLNAAILYFRLQVSYPLTRGSADVPPAPSLRQAQIELRDAQRQLQQSIRVYNEALNQTTAK